MQNNIKQERKKRKITQAQLASLVNVSRQTMNGLENQKLIPSTALALKISIIFEKTVNEIFFLEEKDL